MSRHQNSKLFYPTFVQLFSKNIGGIFCESRATDYFHQLSSIQTEGRLDTFKTCYLQTVGEIYIFEISVASLCPPPELVLPSLNANGWANGFRQEQVSGSW